MQGEIVHAIGEEVKRTVQQQASEVVRREVTQVVQQEIMNIGTEKVISIVQRQVTSIVQQQVSSIIKEQVMAIVEKQLSGIHQSSPNPSYADVARTPPGSHPSNLKTIFNQTTPLTFTDTLHCTVDVSNVEEAEWKRAQGKSDN